MEVGRALMCIANALLPTSLGCIQLIQWLFTDVAVISSYLLLFMRGSAAVLLYSVDTQVAKNAWVPYEKGFC